MAQNSQRKKQQGHSYLPSHPQITKKVSVLSTPQKQKNLFLQKDNQKIRQQLYRVQQQLHIELQTKLSSFRHQNQIFSDSLAYFNPDMALEQLQRELQAIKEDDNTISQQINNCQMIEQTTTPQEYFLFKKNKRLETFNEAIDNLFEEVNKEKEEMRNFIERIRAQTHSVGKEIEDMERQLSHKQEPQDGHPNDHSSHSSESQVAQSKIQLTIESSHSNSEHLSREQSQAYSDQASSIDVSEIQTLNMEYKNLKQTYDIIQENNDIMTTQLVNGIQSIEESLGKHFEGEKSKLFREIMQLKEDFQYMPVEHIISPSETELNYDVAPLIQDYKNKLKEISQKMSSDLKNVTLDMLEPLRWDTVNFDEYLDSPRGKEYRQSQASMSSSKKQQEYKEAKALKQTQAKYNQLQQHLKRQDQRIVELQNDLQQVMGETMTYKQKQHELELAMNNMRKMIRQQQAVF